MQTKTILLIIFGALSALDVLTSLIGLKNGAMEVNSLYIILIDSFGPIAGLILGKLAMIATIMPIYLFLSRFNGQKLFLATLNSIFAFVVSWNVIHI